MRSDHARPALTGCMGRRCRPNPAAAGAQAPQSPPAGCAQVQPLLCWSRCTHWLHSQPLPTLALPGSPLRAQASCQLIAARLGPTSCASRPGKLILRARSIRRPVISGRPWHAIAIAIAGASGRLGSGGPRAGLKDFQAGAARPRPAGSELGKDQTCLPYKRAQHRASVNNKQYHSSVLACWHLVQGRRRHSSCLQQGVSHSPPAGRAGRQLRSAQSAKAMK